MDLQIFLGGVAVVLGLETVVFLVATYVKRMDLADVCWGLGFVVLAWTLFVQQGGGLIPSLALGAVTFWGLRLAGHLFFRLFRKSEDFRYAQWRKEWGNTVLIRSFLQVFLLQGLILCGVATPIFSVFLKDPLSLTWYRIVGALIWCIGMGIEMVADAQLETFARNKANKGSLIQTGLWAHSRHPNYFGEIMLWWGFWLFCTPLTLWTLVSPVLLTFLITKVSGVPLLEKKYAFHPDFEAYKSKTPVLVPNLFMSIKKLVNRRIK